MRTLGSSIFSWHWPITPSIVIHFAHTGHYKIFCSKPDHMLNAKMISPVLALSLFTCWGLESVIHDRRWVCKTWVPVGGLWVPIFFTGNALAHYGQGTGCITKKSDALQEFTMQNLYPEPTTCSMPTFFYRTLYSPGTVHRNCSSLTCPSLLLKQRIDPDQQQKIQYNPKHFVDSSPIPAEMNLCAGYLYFVNLLWHDNCC